MAGEIAAVDDDGVPWHGEGRVAAIRPRFAAVPGSRTDGAAPLARLPATAGPPAGAGSR